AVANQGQSLLDMSHVASSNGASATRAMPDHTPRRIGLPLVIVAAAGFALAHTQSPLFFSNQNQYLLHGLAQADYGHLDRDWLANTKDPTPAFSFLVKVLYQT